MSADLHLKLEGPPRLISAVALGEGLLELHKLLNRVQGADGKTRDVSWRVSALSIGSAVCAIAPPPDATEEGEYRISAAWAGAEQLSHQPGIPDKWTSDAIESLIKLSNLTKRDGVDSATLLRDGAELIRLDEQIKTNAQRSISAPPESIGSVAGKVYRWIDDGRREIGVREAATGHRVIVYFGADLRDRVLEAVGTHRQVRAWGRLKRNAANQKVSLHATGIEAIEEAGLAEPTNAIAGALGPDWTGDLGSVDWVRAQRG
jgi:hypothetical protein